MDTINNNDKKHMKEALDVLLHLGEESFLPAIAWLGDFVEFVKNDMNEAAKWYKKGADLGDGQCSRNYADMLMVGNGVQQNSKEALNYYTKAADAGIPEAAFMIGEFLKNSGENQKALDAYTRALDLGYEPAQIRINQLKDTINKASTIEKPWKNSQGKIECDESKCHGTECVPECPIHRNTIAINYMQKGNFETAIKIYENLVVEEPDFVDAWSNLGTCYGSIRDYERAYQNYKKANQLEVRKNNLIGVALAARETGRVEEAIDYCKEYSKHYNDGALDNVLNALEEAKEDTINVSKDKPMFCRFCGAKMVDGALFCMKCGKKL